MSHGIKENEILAAIPDTASARPAASSTAAPSVDNPARPQPVALEVPVTVNGARTVAGSDKREPFSESTKTVLIFGHGAVVRLSSSVAPGQLLFLTNEKTKKEVVCQVVKSKNYHNVSGYVELEFTESVAGFWGMRFPAAGAPPQTPQAPSAGSTTSTTGTATKISAGGPPVESKSTAKDVVIRPDTKLDTKSTPSSSPRVSPPDVTSTASAGQSSAPPKTNLAGVPHATANTQNTSSISAGLSGSDPSSNVVEISKVKAATTKATAAQTPLLTEKKSPSQATSLLDSEQVKIPSWLEPLARNAAVASAALPEITAKEQPGEDEEAAVVEDVASTQVAESPETTARALPTSSFGTHFLAEDHDSFAVATSTGSNKKFLIAGVAAAVLILAGGGAWYMQQQRASSAGVNSAPSVNTAAPVTTVVDSGNAPPTQAQPQASNVTPSGTLTAVSAPTSGNAGPAVAATNAADAANAGTNLNKRLATVDAPPETVTPRPKKPSLGTVNLSGPVVNRRDDGQAAEALNLEANQIGPGEGFAAGLVSKSRQPVAPPPPLPIGGDVKTAKLISSVAPVYPAIARAQRVAGDVKIDALIDVNGRVSGMKAVSGPPLLQQPAMDAVHNWKYEPAHLDGRPVPMHLTVTVQFKLQ